MQDNEEVESGGKTTPYIHDGLTLCMVTHDR